MRNRGFIITLTVIISLLCLFYLSFSLVSYQIQKDANAYAMDSKGNINYNKRQRYYDSLWNLPVYNLGFAKFTLREVKDFELHLGLDLQGGMHVVLEVSPVDVIKALSGDSKDPNFLQALANTQKLAIGSQRTFTEIFFDEYEKLAGPNQLSKVFANAANQGIIDFKTPEPEIKRIITNEVENAIERSYRIVKSRIDKFGVTNPNVQRIPGTGRIQVELPGVDNPERVRKLLQGVAKLEFWEVYEPNEYSEFLQKINDFAISKKKTTTTANNTSTSDTDKALASLTDGADTLKATGDSAKVATAPSQKEDSAAIAKRMIDSLNNVMNQNASALFTKLVRINPNYFELIYEARDTAAINDIIFDPEMAPAIPPTAKFLWGVKPTFEDQGKQYYTLYVIKKSRGNQAPLDGEAIKDARQGFDDRGRPDVQMVMNAEGSKIWKKLTGANVNRRIAIVLDNSVYSAPVVQSEIAGGNSSISGNFTIEEAQDLANILKVGKLPAPTRIVEEAVVGPSLGREAIQQGLISVVVGFLAVVIFMAVYYAGAGLVANGALLFNVFFIVGILANFEAALTLPGIAGIVLTIGMAVDANVLVFERIREEMRNQKPMLEAIELGYERAFWSIFDSNLTTLLTAFFLYTLGTGPIKGFAITLIIGIFCSFFTAVYVSRVIIYSLTHRKSGEGKISFATPFTLNAFRIQGVDFIGKRKLAYAFSGAIIVIGIILMLVQGLNLGVDFKGGRTYIVEFNQNVIASEVRSKLSAAFQGQGTEVKIYDTNNKVKVTTTYLIDDDSDEADEKVLAALKEGLKNYSQLNPQILSSSKVGATIASDIRDSAIESIFASLLAIFAYIFLRFRKWQFGLGAVLALFHDVLIVMSCVAIARLLGFSVEIDQVFVAAILTIIGYSINDTVVVFDRVRESLAGGAANKQELVAGMNKAVNDTFSRTIITALTTFLVVFVLFVAGGEVLRGFSFAMLLGVIFGTYSSIFIASAIVTDTMESIEPAVVPKQGGATAKAPVKIARAKA
ncbi:MAG: protein translocase subunit SecDF [Cytophagales bacterium]|nr:protein translocase subunit SecDF [Bernardetiaceae bacterium]MDW8205948.1 protein translocase subunit SecDF [Cytophagales bacterium]